MFSVVYCSIIRRIFAVNIHLIRRKTIVRRNYAVNKKVFRRIEWTDGLKD